jgi:hypothetical protein
VKDGSTDEEKDLLFGWIKEEDVKAAILFDPSSTVRGWVRDVSH